jgi:hypothetical protein
VEKRRGREGWRSFPADRTPDLCNRSLFGFGTVEFGIAELNTTSMYTNYNEGYTGVV